MSGADGVLVTCPVCLGAGMLSNGHPDPQLQEDGDCHACAGGGAVTEQHQQELLDSMTDAALARWERHVAAEAADARWVEQEYARELQDRDREWWA